MADSNKLYLWEILIPATRHTGQQIKPHFHRTWDKRVRKITKGLTIMQPVRGQWISNDGKLFLDKMIPVRIACTDEAIHKIANFSAEYYDQQSIMYYRLSGVIFFAQRKKESLTKQLEPVIMEEEDGIVGHMGGTAEN